MFNTYTSLTLIIFFLTVLFIIWKPFGLNETIPTTIGAVLLIILGIVPFSDVSNILTIVSGPSFTILSTIVMSLVLESVGLFKWVAVNILRRADGSGHKLFLYVILLCYFTTLFFNNDGSILITTPIIITIVKQLKLKPYQQIPYLLSGALVATASSAPIAVSNIANLIALKIVGLDLNTYVAMLFIPSMIGITIMAGLLYVYYRHHIPYNILKITTGDYLFNQKKHPLDSNSTPKLLDEKMFKWAISLVILIRCGYFVLTPLGVPIEWIAIVGAVVLLGFRWARYKTGIKDVIIRTPWHILLFAFSMYVIVFGLQQAGLTTYLIHWLTPIVHSNQLNAIFIMGLLLSILSNLVNNLPSVMIGTLALTHLHLSQHAIQIAYLANIVGSDIGSLLTPMGTLASLIWMYILKSHHINFSWGQYIKVTILIIPVSLFITLISFYLWIQCFFA